MEESMTSFTQEVQEEPQERAEDSEEAAEAGEADAEAEDEIRSDTQDGISRMPSTPPASALTSLPSPPSTTPTGPSEEDRRFGTILAVIQFRPETSNEQSREVWVSVNNGVGNREDFPLIRFTTATQWQEVLDTLLDELKRDLPRRKLLHEQRKTHKSTAASGGTVVRPTASPAARKAVAPAAPVPATPPPVPTTSSPISKQDLAMPGLFDDL